MRKIKKYIKKQNLQNNTVNFTFYRIKLYVKKIGIMRIIMTII